MNPDVIPGFGEDPWWIIAIKVLFIFVVLVVFTLFNVWAERRVVARMQHRLGAGGRIGLAHPRALPVGKLRGKRLQHEHGFQASGD